MACDICGKTDVPLVSLLDTYKTNDIAQICYDCETIVNKKQRSVHNMTMRICSDLVKRFMRERKERAA